MSDSNDRPVMRKRVYNTTTTKRIENTRLTPDSFDLTNSISPTRRSLCACAVCKRSVRRLWRYIESRRERRDGISVRDPVRNGLLKRAAVGRPPLYVRRRRVFPFLAPASLSSASFRQTFATTLIKKAHWRIIIIIIIRCSLCTRSHTDVVHVQPGAVEASFSEGSRGGVGEERGLITAFLKGPEND